MFHGKYTTYFANIFAHVILIHTSVIQNLQFREIHNNFQDETLCLTITHRFFPLNENCMQPQTKPDTNQEPNICSIYTKHKHGHKFILFAQAKRCTQNRTPRRPANDQELFQNGTNFEFFCERGSNFVRIITYNIFSRYFLKANQRVHVCVLYIRFFSVVGCRFRLSAVNCCSGTKEQNLRRGFFFPTFMYSSYGITYEFCSLNLQENQVFRIR